MGAAAAGAAAAATLGGAVTLAGAESAAMLSELGATSTRGCGTGSADAVGAPDGTMSAAAAGAGAGIDTVNHMKAAPAAMSVRAAPQTTPGLSPPDRAAGSGGTRLKSRAVPQRHTSTPGGTRRPQA